MSRYHANQVAQQLLDIASKDNKTLTPMQVLKLVYLCHGWMLGVYERPLIQEKVMAWPYGPVIRDLYATIRHYRWKPVKEIPSNDDWQPLDEHANDLIRQVFDAYGHLTGPQLSALTHAEGTPWYKTRYQGAPRNRIIHNNLIREHFKALAAKNNAA